MNEFVCAIFMYNLVYVAGRFVCDSNLMVVYADTADVYQWDP